MNNDFLFHPSQIQQAFESNSSSGSSGNEITRRSFIKRTGGATVATLVAWNLITNNAKASTPGHADHCPAHGSYCTYISDITVVFKTVTTPPARSDYASTGKIFHGTLTYTSYYCGSNNPTPRSYPVHTGGYLEPGSSVVPPNDSACPATATGHPWKVTPKSTGTGPDGFPVATPNTGRGKIEIHHPGASTGCIVFDDLDDYNTFAGEIRCNNFTNCVHPLSNPLVVIVQYQGVTPVGNAPGS